MKTRLRCFSFILLAFSLQIVLVSAVGAVINIMPFGDSNTRGFSGSTDETGYRRSLYMLLTEASYSVDFVGNPSSGIPNDFDKNHEGHSGFSDDEVADMVYEWLTVNPTDIVLLHIGTNSVAESPADVENILTEIDRFESDNGVMIWVILALIINRNCVTWDPPCPESVTTANFNKNVAAMAQDRIDLLGDKIYIVDMENWAGIDYHLSTNSPPGDMWDYLHPFDTGYEKMANVWFFGLMEILDSAISDENLIYTTAPPCRIIDTRLSQGGAGPIVGGTQRNFSVTGLCGLPSGPAKAVMINIAAVNATGAGNLRAFPYPQSVPSAATLSYGVIPGLYAISNAAIIPICDPAAFPCFYDLSIFVSKTTNVVVDVMGYFTP